MSASEPSEPAPSPRAAAACAAVRDWPGYFDAIGDAGPRQTLIEAMNRFEMDHAIDLAQRPLAIDIGCGTGRDTLELLRRGWRVLALDGVSSAIQRMLDRPEFAPFRDDDRLDPRIVAFEDMSLPPCELINVSYTLPFCSPAQFKALWPKIVKSIRRGGRFAGQFFGEQDDWANLPDRTHHTRDTIETLLNDFDIEHFETELYGPNPDSMHPKRWHIFHVVARKR